jgi:hypothetical protein
MWRSHGLQPVGAALFRIESDMGKRKLFHDTKMILTKQFKQIKQLTQNGKRSVFIL